MMAIRRKRSKTLVILMSRLINDEHDDIISVTKSLPRISFIIAAYNEEKVIERKILNTLALNYPVDKMQVIVVSDGSNDRTDEIVKRYINKRVLSLHEPARCGKSAALNRAVEHSNGEILIGSNKGYFSFHPDQIKLQQPLSKVQFR